MGGVVNSEMDLRKRSYFYFFEFGGWGAMDLKTNVSRIRVRFTRQRLRIKDAPINLLRGGRKS